MRGCVNPWLGKTKWTQPTVGLKLFDATIGFKKIKHISFFTHLRGEQSSI